MGEPNQSGILVSVLRHADGCDCTNGGLSSRHKELTLILPEGGPFEPTPDRPGVVVEERYFHFSDEPYLTAYPVDRNTGMLWMAGGNYIEASDDRFPGRYPIPLHDRTEP